MCGITGFFDPAGFEERWASDLVAEMARAIEHRGPDDHGTWVDGGAGVALGHRRLSIIDLSPLGHQPMVSQDGRYVVVFNGEIYNFVAMRRDLERDHGVVFLGNSDTEVILEAFAHWGVERTLTNCVGMFALALWDREQRTLTLARDRLGEKPLYWGWSGGVLLFGSELKAVRRHPRFDDTVDRTVLGLFLQHSYVPGDHCIYADLHKLPPGTWVTITADSKQARPSAYWSARRAWEAPVFVGDEHTAIDALEAALKTAVGLQMVADVPLGAFLSGGIDSSTVVALMQEQSSRPVSTFTIGFSEAKFNEAEYAREVSRRLGTDHTEIVVSPEQASAVIPTLPTIYDEPFADSSQIPTFLVSQLARQHVTVSLSGDGGDELFSGYHRYRRTERLWRWVGMLPADVRQIVAGTLRAVPASAWQGLGPILATLGVDTRARRPPADRARALADVLDVPDARMLYARMTQHWKRPWETVIGASVAAGIPARAQDWARCRDLATHMSWVDAVSYLPDDILVKVDRAAMSVSLETRVPLLDHRVVELAASLPTGLKVRHGVGKWALRQVLYRRLDASLFERRKAGFSVPIGQWLRGPFREWADHLLNERRLRQEGFFDPTLITQRWTEHRKAECDWHYYLWDVLMFQAWLEATRT